MTGSSWPYGPSDAVRSHYAQHREWSDQFVPQIARLVGPHLLIEAPLHVDQKQATDLIVLKARDMTVAARMRRPGYVDRFGHQFTVRAKLDSGAPTELSKLLDGWGDVMFYGHAADLRTSRIAHWMLIDLHRWRSCLLRCSYREGWQRYAQRVNNGDGTHFVAFDVRQFVDPPIVIAQAPDVHAAFDRPATGLGGTPMGAPAPGGGSR